MFPEDTDVLVLLINRSPEIESHDILFIPHLKKSSKKKLRIWPIKEVRTALGPELCKHLLFIHAFSGCDTTSRPYGMGKASVVKKVIHDEELRTCASIFVDPQSPKEKVIEAGDLAMRLLTGGNKKESLAVHRFKVYKCRVIKGNIQVLHEFLPPTSGSTEQHSLRVYHQIMSWTGNGLSPDQYGLELKYNKLRPTISNNTPAPQDMLRAIFCNCKTSCDTKRCTCRRFNLACTDLCTSCLNGCLNSSA